MDKVVIVTGAGGWLGSAIATCFGQADDMVLLCDINKAAIDDIAVKINQGRGKAATYVANTVLFDEVDAMVQHAIKLWGRVDVIVCVAGGVLSRLRRTTKAGEKLLIEYTDEDWDLVVDSNLKGAFQCIRAVAKPMMAQKDGHIILVGSAVGSQGGIKRSAYAASKAGMLGLMKCAAMELGEHNIRVNVVIPGRNPHPGEVSDPRGTILKRTNTPSDEVAPFFVQFSQLKNVSGQIVNLDSRIIF